MKEILEIASNVSTPLALGGLIAAILFLILRQIVAKDIFPELTKAVGGDILKIIIERLFVLALVAMVLGFIGFVITQAFPTQERKAADSISVNLPDGIKFKDAVKFLAQLESFTVDFKEGCYQSLMNAEVEGGPLKGKSTVELINQLRFRLKEPKLWSDYGVTKLQESGVYEITCN